jgi:hypothetical protein
LEIISLFGNNFLIWKLLSIFGNDGSDESFWNEPKLQIAKTVSSSSRNESYLVEYESYYLAV